MAASALPPGPKGHLVSGNLPEFRRDPLGFLTQCARQYGDIVRLRFYLIPAVLLNHPDTIERVLVTRSRDFAKGRGLEISRRIFGNGLLTSEGDFWLRQRRLSQPAFHRERIAAYGKVMVSYAERLLASWRDGECRDVHDDMMRLTLEIVAKTLFDADVAGEAREVGEALEVFMEQFVSLRSLSRRLIPESVPTPWNLRYRKAIERLDGIVHGIIRRRRASGRDAGDLLSMLLNAQDEDGSRMTDQQLRDEAVTLFLAGHETTALALSWAWVLLSGHPEVEAKLVAELKEALNGRSPEVTDLPRLRFTEQVVMETMRLYPPAWGIGRKALRDFEAGRYRVPAGTQIAMSQWVMHRDPRFYDDPERFNPGRWTEDFQKRLPNFAYFPFGGGPRVCIGASFAKMEAVLLLATIAQRFRLTLVPGHPVTPFPAITLRPKDGIKVTLTRR